MKVYTLGYEKRNINEFIEMLKQANVQILIDVRQTAWSYKRDFCKTKFKEALMKDGIHYVHVRELGNPKQLRNSNVNRRTVLNMYKKYLQKTESGIGELTDLIMNAKKSKSNVCLTCFEREHEDCHRSIIVDHIKSSISINVMHL